MVHKEPNYRFGVLFATFTAAGLVFLLHIVKGQLKLFDTSVSEDTLRNTFSGDSVNNAIVSWGFIMVVLFAGASFETTAALAAAFAWLLLVTVLIYNADLLIKITGTAPGDIATNHTSGSGGGSTRFNLPS